MKVYYELYDAKGKELTEKNFFDVSATEKSVLCQEKENTDETIGKFVKYCMNEFDYEERGVFPVLSIEDSDGNVVEYYLFTTGKVLKHWKKKPSYEDKIAKRVWDYEDPYYREEEDTVEQCKEDIINSPFHVIEFLLDLLDGYAERSE